MSRVPFTEIPLRKAGPRLLAGALALAAAACASPPPPPAVDLTPPPRRPYDAKTQLEAPPRY
jgi:hypothetical protein